MQIEEEFANQTKPVAEESEVKAPELGFTSEIVQSCLIFFWRVKKACQKDKKITSSHKYSHLWLDGRIQTCKTNISLRFRGKKEQKIE